MFDHPNSNPKKNKTNRIRSYPEKRKRAKKGEIEETDDEAKKKIHLLEIYLHSIATTTTKTLLYHCHLYQLFVVYKYSAKPPNHKLTTSLYATNTAAAENAETVGIVRCIGMRLN